MDDFSFAYPLNNLGEVQNERGATALAANAFNEALKVAQDNQHKLWATINLNLGRAECNNGLVSEGLLRIGLGRAALVDHYDADNWRYAIADEFESRCRAAMGETDKARGLAESGYERLREQLGDEHYFTQRAKKWMVGLEEGE